MSHRVKIRRAIESILHYLSPSDCDILQSGLDNADKFASEFHGDQDHAFRIALYMALIQIQTGTVANSIYHFIIDTIWDSPTAEHDFVYTMKYGRLDDNIVILIITNIINRFIDNTTNPFDIKYIQKSLILGAS